MERYSEYKDSGISWIGKVPKHWVTYRFATLCKTISICDCINEELLSVFLDRGVIRFSDDENRRTNPTSKDLSKYQLVEPGDFVLNNQQAWRGSVGVSNYRGIVSPAYFVFKLSPELNREFANYMFRSRNYVASYCVCSKGIGSIQRNLDWGQLKQRNMFLPPLAEQEKIVSYLERKTSKIDAYVADKEKEIQLLQELKQETIAEAVTKGLNPDVKMKDSGISWIGMIPEHWEVKKIGSLFMERREKVSDKDYPALSVSKQGITPQLETAVKTDNGDNRKKVCKDDFVVNSRSDRKGSCGVSPYTGSVSLINIVLSPRNNIEVQYFHHLFRSNDYIEEYYRIGRGIVADLWTTRYSEMRNIMVPLPPLDEQQSIVAYIEEKCQKIDTLITELQAEIDYLKEYKQRLIADVVTGQVNVQNETI